MTSGLIHEHAPSAFTRASQPVRKRIAIAGCGVVGSALLRLLEQHGERSPYDVKSVLVRDAKRRRDCDVSERLLTTALDDFLDADAEIVVEALGGIEPAKTIAQHTLSRGGTFITANKALVAVFGADLERLARQHQGTFRFDATVGAGVPAIRLLESSLGGDRPRAVRGILNGTSNFVLTLLEQGASFETALAEARRRGFAEADVSRDLDGRDAADKVAILAWRAFGLSPQDVRVRRVALPPDPARLVTLASALDGSVRQLGECELLDDGRTVVASVEPVIVRPTSGFARTVFEENRIEIDAGWSSPLSVSGPGAGGAPTAAALLSDLLSSAADSESGRTDARSVHDGRLFHWIVAARCSPAELQSVLRATSVEWRRLWCARGETFARTRPLPHFAVERALTDLEARGAEPLVARLEDAFAWERAA